MGSQIGKEVGPEVSWSNSSTYSIKNDLTRIWEALEDIREDVEELQRNSHKHDIKDIADEDFEEDRKDFYEDVIKFDKEFREEITYWNYDSVYVKGDLVRYRDDFYVGIADGAWRTKCPFDAPDYWQKLDKLPEDNVDIDVYAYLTRNDIDFDMSHWDDNALEWYYTLSESDIKNLISRGE